MSRTVMVGTLVSLILVAYLLGNQQKSPVSVPHAAGSIPVKLAVVLIFDQMRGDYVQKWQPLFGSGGFRRIQREGVWFPNCYYPYASTSTGPGHSALLSGATLDQTGIINNEWYDRPSSSTVYCAGSDRYDLVPKPVVAAAPTSAKADESAKKPKVVGNPDRMLAETVADVLKRNSRGKVFGLSLKDRSAILPTGKTPTGAFWFNGNFTTSTYYTDVLPRWVEQFNQSHFADQWYGKSWDRFRPKLDYVALSGPDDVAGENKANGRGLTFPHKMTGGKDKLGKEYYDALANSPYGNELLLAFTKSCIVHERLGQGEQADLLVVSFSSNDLIGHTFGPDSQEVLDVTLRSDEIVASLLAFLDQKVGAGQYSVAISADHGICPLPEVAVKTIPEAHDATRVSTVKLLLNAETHLRKLFGKPIGPEEKVEDLADETKASKGKQGLWIEAVPAPWVYLNEQQIAAKQLKKADVAQALADWLKQQSGIQTAYTAEEIRNNSNPDETLKMVQRSYFPGRCGDVYILLKPYHLIGDPLKAKGTGHGTPHSYDRHVPLMVYGPGLEPGRREEAVTPQQMAAIVSHFLGLPKPAQARYDLPASLLVP
jgi:predicted AlkP superfamily pyrophosphatase or phosphodiesterase